MSVKREVRAADLGLKEHELLSTILDESGALIVVLDREGGIVLFNRACERLTGYTFEDVEGTFVWDRLLILEEREAVKAVFADLKTGHFPNEHENFWVAKDRTRRCFRWSNTALRGDDGSVAHVIGTGIDVTERRCLENRFRLAVEALPNAVIVVDEGGGIVLANSRTEELFGYAPEELLGQPVDKLVPERFRSWHCHYRAQFFNEGRVQMMGTGRDVFGLRKDVSEFPVEIGLSRIEAEEGRRVVCAISDITERKRAEQESKQRLDELAQFGRVASMAEMASGLAHEINQPLTAITSYAEACSLMLQSGSPDAEVMSDAVKEIARQAHRAGDIVKHMRHFVKGEEIATTTIGVNSLVREVLDLCAHDLKARSVSVVVERDETLPPVEANKTQIEQVLVNLVRNAIDAMERADRVERILSVSTGRGAIGQSSVEVAVSDTGEGVDPEIADRLFDALFTTKAGGMGIGLSISKRIIEAHGGSLTMSPNKDAGVTFRFSLPIDAMGRQQS